MIVFRTHSNITQFHSNAAVDDKSSSGNKAYVLNDGACISNKENQDVKKKETIDTENSYPVSTCSPTRKKGKLNETKELEQTFCNISNRIMNYMETSKLPTTDDAFVEFIKIQLNTVPEHEKHIRRIMIMDAISTPITKM